MNPVIEAVRQKYPGAYDDLSDDDLTRAIAAKTEGAYMDVPRFKADFDRLTAPKLTPSLPEPGQQQMGGAPAPSPLEVGQPPSQFERVQERAATPTEQETTRKLETNLVDLPIETYAAPLTTIMAPDMARGFAAATKRLIEGQTSPVGLAQTAYMLTPMAEGAALGRLGMAGRTLGAAFGAQGVAQLPDAVKRYVAAVRAGNRQEAASAWIDLAAASGMSFAGLESIKGIARAPELQPQPPLLPLSERAAEAAKVPPKLATTPTESEVSDASRYQEAGEVHAPVPVQPGESARTVPVEEGGQGVQSHGVEAPKEVASQRSATEQAVPWGKKAVLEYNFPEGSPERRQQQVVFNELTNAFGVRKALDMTSGKEPYPSLEEFRSATERFYEHEGHSLERRLVETAKSIGADATQIPSRDQFATSREFYDAMLKADMEVQNSGVRAVFAAGTESLEAKSKPAPPTEQAPPRKIVAVVSKLGDTIVSGRTHYEAESKLRSDLGITLEDPRVEDIEHGFLDNLGNFLDRQQAWNVAEQAKQIQGPTEEPGFLGGEDIKTKIKPPPASTEAAPPSAAPATAAVSEAKPPGVAAPEAPSATTEATPLATLTQPEPRPKPISELTDEDILKLAADAGFKATAKDLTLESRRKSLISRLQELSDKNLLDRSVLTQPRAGTEVEKQAQPGTETPAAQVERPGATEDLYAPAKNWVKQQSDALRGFVLSRMDAYDRWKAAKGKAKQQAKVVLDNFDRELEQAKQVHHDAVEQAYNEGKPVPPDVLKDYPDLANLMPTKALSPAPVAAKVQAEVSRVARTEGARPAKDVKAELLSRIEDAMKGAPEKSEWTAGKHGYVEINIPGDGNFRIARNLGALGDIRKRVERMGTSGKPSPAKQIPIPKEKIDSDDIAAQAKTLYGDARSAITHLERQLGSEQEIEPATRTATELAIEKLREELPEVIREKSIQRIQKDISELESRIKIAEEGKRVLLQSSGGRSRLNRREDQILASHETAIKQSNQSLTEKRAALAELQKQAAVPISKGPGAAASGEPGTYSAIKQLSDQMETAPAKTVQEGLRLRERMADKVAGFKDAATRILARARAIPATLKQLSSGVRTFNDVDRRVGELDYALQRSAGLSREAGDAIAKGIKNDAMRDATAIWIDAKGDETAIRETLSNLPEGTTPRVRRALEAALDLPEDVKTKASEISQYFQVREEEAIAEGIFDQGLEDYYTHIWKRKENMPGSVLSALNSGRISEYFKFARQRKIPTFLEGIQQGKEPLLDPAKVVPYYNYLLDRAIASRKFVKSLEEVNAADGRPVLAAVGTRSVIKEGDVPKATLIKLRVAPEGASDYRSIDHPALRKWKWAAMDENGAPVFYEGDLRVHPDHFERLANMMDRSRLNPSNLARLALRASTEVKGFKLGVASFFHPIQVGTHALFHWTSPIVRGEIDWEAPATKFAIEKGGLQIAPDPRSIAEFSEGILTPGLIHQVPIIGPLSRALSEWTFADYIPKLKLQTFETVLARDKVRYKGKLSDEQIAQRAGDAVNNAFGELNRLWLGKHGRDPRFQRFLRGIFLAPDFGEARLRFVSKAATRFGGEERLALATAGIGLFLAARVGNMLSHGDPELEDWHHWFDVKTGNRWFGVRSIVGDISHLITKPRQFWEVRLNPLYSRTALAALSGRNPSGHKFAGVTDFAADIGKQFVPIHLGALTRDDQRLWESFLGAMGAQSWKASATAEIHRVARDWREKRGIKDNTEILAGADSPYRKARLALEFQDRQKFHEAIGELTKQRQAAGDRTPRKTIETNFRRYYHMPFAGNARLEGDFRRSLNERDRRLYQDAKKERDALWTQFQAWY